MLTVFSKYNCKYCSDVKEFFNALNIPFEEVNIEDDAKAAAWVKDQGHKTVPQIYKDGSLFVEGGATGLFTMDMDELLKSIN